MIRNEDFIKNIRKYFVKEGFSEITTPRIIKSPLPEPHINAVKADNGYYITSPELYLKIHLSDFPEDIFELASCRRLEESGRLHKECFSMLEWYKVNAVYTDLIEFITHFLLFMAEETFGTSKIIYQNMEIDFASPCSVFTVEEVFKKYGSKNLTQALKEGLFEEILVTEIEPALPKNVPVILKDYPSEFAALSKFKKSNPAFCERWELYLSGIEIANTYTELTGYDEHLKRFSEFTEERGKNKKTEYYVIDEFKNALKKGIPESAGCALGIDRLFMIFADMPSIPQFNLLRKGETV